MATERKKLTNQLDKLCRDIIRARDNDTCQIDNVKVYGSNSHPCHVVAKGNGASWRRFDLMNIFLGGMRGHRWWHNNPLDSAEWFKDKFPVVYEYLDKYRHGKAAKISTQEMRDLVIEYKQKLKGKVMAKHPEDYCHICQRKNIVWHADNDLWNKVVGDEGLICCPICFVEMAEKKGFSCTSWRISQDSDDPLVDKLRLEIANLKDSAKTIKEK